MKLKGIEKGDQNFRHFTFDDDDYIQKNGVYYYRVNYGKNKLEGPDAEDEIGFVSCTKVIPLGGKGPRYIPGQEKKASEPMQYMPPNVTPSAPAPAAAPEVSQEPKRRGRPPKVKILEGSNETIQVAPQEGTPKFEYYVSELTFTNSANLQELLNKLGEEGWELCGFEGSRNMFAATHIVAVFKRKRG